MKASTSAAWSAAERGVAGRGVAVGVPRPEPAPVGPAQLEAQEVAGRRRRRRSSPARSSSAPASASAEIIRRVPLGEHLVVEAGAGPLLAGVEQAPAGRPRSPAGGRTRRGRAGGWGSSGPRSCRSAVMPNQLERRRSASAPSTARTSSTVHVWNRPSWPWPSGPGESASSAEENPPAGWRRSRSTYSTVSATTWRQRGSSRATAAWA